MEAQLSIEHIGPLVGIHDKGRHGYMRYGVTGAGPMDRLSHTLANKALGNSPDRPCIEVSLGGITLRCTDGYTTAAIAGGHFNCTLNGQTLPPWCRFELEAGSQLQIRPGPWGSWCYLAFGGQLQSQQWLGSQSLVQGTDLCGTPLQQHDTIEVTDTDTAAPASKSGAVDSLQDPTPLRPDDVIRVVLGPQDRYFTEASLHALAHSAFTLTADYNRMGIRLSGPSLSINTELTMPSAPITRGSIQVPGHGDPICLMADHQTTGGYPKIATIISADQDKLAQLRSGDQIRFEVIDADAAIVTARARQQQLTALMQLMNDNTLGLDERLLSSNLISGVVDARPDLSKQ